MSSVSVIAIAFDVDIVDLFNASLDNSDVDMKAMFLR